MSHTLDLQVQPLSMKLKEKKMQMYTYRVGDDDIESPYKIVPEIFDFFVSVFASLS